MKSKFGSVCTAHSVAQTRTPAKHRGKLRNRPSRERSALPALCAAAAAFALAIAWSPSASAQSNVDIQPIVPFPPVLDLNQSNTNTASPQTNTNTTGPIINVVVADTTVFPPLVFVDTVTAAESIAVANAIIIGSGVGPNPPIVVNQTNTETTFVNPLVQTNTNPQEITAVAVASSGIIDLTYTLSLSNPGGDALSALSSATANARFDVRVSQANNNNPPPQTNPASPFTQTVTQTNNTDQDFTAVAVADANPVAGNDVVILSTGPTLNSGANAINARSLASANSHIGNIIAQLNTNAITVEKTTSGSFVANQVVNQSNTLNQEFVAVSIAAAGDIGVTRQGSTEADGNAVNAESDASANADTANAATQTNTNSFIATKSNNNNNQTLTQNQTSFNQNNSNDELSVAGAGAFSGDIAVLSEGDTTAGGHGVNAVTHAFASARISNGATLNQSNINAMNGSTSVGTNVDLTQNQTIAQSNTADKTLIAVAVAVAGDVTVTRSGKTKVDGTGINAVSQAITETASINNSATQANSGSLVGSTVTAGSDLTQTQNATQTNTYEQLGVAVSVAVSGDATAQNSGDIEAGGHGINAASQANAGPATINTSLSQSNTNGLRGTTTGGTVGTLAPDNASLTQTQTVNQTNSAELIDVAASIAVAGDAIADSKGDVKSGGTGINANSIATTSSSISESVSQANLNGPVPCTADGCITPPTASTTGANATIGQTQTVNQTNELDRFSFATSVAVAGDAKAKSKGDINADGNGINAKSEASAESSVGATVDQTNTNSLSAATQGTGAGITQTQTPNQQNDLFGISAATSVAVADDAKVKSRGDIKAGDNGINAVSSADASAANNSAVSQSNVNPDPESVTQNTATTSGANSPITQTQNVTQENESAQFSFATSVAVADDVDVRSKGDIDAKNNGINAVSVAKAGSTINSSIDQSNENNLTASTTGNGSLIAQGLFQVGVAGIIDPPFGSNTPFDLSTSLPGGQTVNQSNSNGQIALATSFAKADDVTVKSVGNIEAGEHGVNAASVAVAESSVGSAVTQRNANDLSASTAGGLGTFAFPIGGGLTLPLPVPALIVQNQSVEQINFNGELLAATSIARAGDVSVSREGDTKSEESAIDATSVAVASAGVNSTVDQTNTNAASAETSGVGAVIAQGPFSISAPFNFSFTIPLVGTTTVTGAATTNLGGGQDVDQSNINLQGLFATSIANADDVTVNNTGNLTSGENGIEAESIAKAAAGINNTVNQTNTNTLHASTTGDAALIFQNQGVEQVNVNGQLMAATSVAEADDVRVNNEGNTDAREDGINAKSVAEAASGITTTVTQANRNGPPAPPPAPADPAAVVVAPATAETTGILAIVTQSQEAEQINFNGQLQFATSIAEADDVKVDTKGDSTAGDDGIDARSSATAAAGINNTIDQSNQNSLSARTGPASAVLQGDLANLLSPGQSVLQANINAQLMVATSVAESDDVRVKSSGNSGAGDEGIDAVSEASAASGINNSVTQANTNALSATTLAALQVQLAIQANANLESATALAFANSGDVKVDQSGTLTAGDDGINAVSSANAAAGVVQTADQANINGVDGTGALMAQLQVALQINANVQDGQAIAIANSDDVTVNQFGDLTAGGDGIVATSSAAAAAAVNQTAGQRNNNSAHIALGTLGANTPPIPGIPELPIEVGAGLGIQGQLVGQFNINVQDGTAVALAFSDDVRVKSENDPALGNGILATSSASAAAAVVQGADQSNINTATIDLPVPPTEGQVPLGVGAQIEGVLQANLSLQDGEAIALANSDDVTVDQSGVLSAGESGIVATSSAAANAAVVQTAKQSNSDTKRVSLPLPTDPQAPLPVPQGGIALQLQGILQANLSEQEGVAVSTALSDDVNVKQSGELTVGVDGINAASTAAANAAVVQTADQSNANLANARVGIAIQAQLAGQFNVNGQAGAAIATAVSDDVTVEQSGTLTAGGGGIIATSSAAAQAAVGQTATQNNNNAATATLGGTETEVITDGGFASVDQIDELGLGLQVQLAAQVNVNEQRGVAVATAISDDVKVKSENDPAGGNGINAVSSADTGAAVVQTATQGNENSAEATFTAPSTTAFTPEPAQVPVTVDIDQAEGADIALQAQLVGQVNLNSQGGMAVATAISDDVKVAQSGLLEAGGTGIVATSSADAGSAVVQTATQNNKNTATATFNGPSATVDVTAPAAVVVLNQIDGIDIGLQAQIVGQANLSSQRGASIATAISDDVRVEQFGNLTAGTDGIVAASTATAEAATVQTVTQSNENSAAQTFNGPQANVRAQAGDGQPDAPQQPPIPEDASVTVNQVDELDVAVQGQLVGQINLSGQRGLAVATAVSGDVKVKSENDPAGGDGIRATSSAEALAPVVQTATQTNSNSATATFNGSQANIQAQAEDSGSVTVNQIDGLDLGLQLQLVGQANLSSQRGLAVATAISDDVHVEQSGILEAGGAGIVATSSAKAEAPVVQTASQSNANTADQDFGPSEIDVTASAAQGSFTFAGEGGGSDIALQGQLVGQINLSGQGGAAIATAISDDVTVKHSGNLTAGGDGIVATSSAEAVAPVVQTATQNNSNSASASLSGSADETQTRIGGDGVSVALQLQIVGQANISGQRGLAVATAISDDVRVTSENDPAGGNGIVATSSAKATAPVIQTAEQTNENKAEATFTGEQDSLDVQSVGQVADPQAQGTDATANLQQVDGVDLALQGQLVGQVNLNRQRGLAVATAVSDDVNIEHSGVLEAGGDGIVGISKAEAQAAVVQTAEQKNKNEAEATFEGDQAEVDATAGDAQSGEGGQATGGDATANLQQVDGVDLALQGQLVGQVNLSNQRGASIATAIADDVAVEQSGNLTAGDDGIVAISKAAAEAAVVQTAEQKNKNEAKATFEGQQADMNAAAGNAAAGEGGQATGGGATANLQQTDGVDLALQGQLVGQVNLSNQRGASIATATSDDVYVTSQDDPAGGDGIVAISKAEAQAAVVQTAEQKNKNEAEATFEGQQTDMNAEAGDAATGAGGQATGGDATANLQQTDGVDLALQGQLVGQVNLSNQRGASIATAIADDVAVEQSGNLTAGDDGIVAISKAGAEAAVVQTAEQKNKNEAEATFEGQQADLNAEAGNAAAGENGQATGGDATANLQQTDGVDLALQGQLVGQVNLSRQRGASIATATSDDVEVKQSGTLTAGGDGIVAISKAESQAAVVQTAEQKNKNEAEATFRGQQADLNADAGEATTGEGGQATGGDATANLQQTDGVDLALQGQLVGQVNLSTQHGLAIATAISDDVDVTSQEDPAGGNGIVATSSAAANAPVVQTATQSNTNSATATFEGAQNNIDVQAEGLGTVQPGLPQDPLNIALQGQIVGQVNLSGQGGLAVATAVSDKVKVDQSGALGAGGSGIIATSSAEAVAPVVQTVTQSNENTAAATFGGSQTNVGIDAEEARIVVSVQRIPLDLAAQGQLLGQVNLNAQLGASVATAISDEVKVKQSGNLTAGADGIVATSSAVAGAAVVQTANQSNTNSADVVFEPSTLEVTFGENEPEVDEFDGINVALQGQLAGQINASLQGGAAIATAVSDKVKVTSETDPAGGNGINAASSAEAGAAVVQTVGTEGKEGLEPGQSNVNSAGVTEPGEASLGLQLQGALQVNLSVQGGLAVATAVSDKVRVNQTGSLTAGGNGIVATSSAVSGAVVDQQAAQSNLNKGQIPTELAVGEEPEVPEEPELAGIALQGQASGQVNVNVQAGAAIATAFSDEVNVNQSGLIEAGGDGIVATSSAISGAAVVQSADQSNAAELDASALIALQGQLAGQLNVNVQAGLAVSVAVSDEVNVVSENDPAGGSGIVASSAAASLATVDQSVYQTNDTEISADGRILPISIAGQLNVSFQEGAAIAVALSDDVSVIQVGDLTAGGDGINASSAAAAEAKVKQKAEQENEAGRALQDNFAVQEGSAFALAASSNVTVVQKGNLTAGGTGIKAVSSASATAKVKQKVEQYNGVLPSPGGETLQFARTAAVSVAQNVSIESENVTAGGDGVVGISTANSKALGGNLPLGLVTAEEQQQALQSSGADQSEMEAALALVPFDPSAFAFAKSGQVDIVTNGAIVATGYGVYAVSYAGATAKAKDGNSAAIAQSGDVNVTVNGDVTAGKTGVFAGSIAKADANGGLGFEQETQGNVTVQIKSGTVTGGAGFYGIQVAGGGQNTITIGENATVTSLSMHAIAGGDFNETVNNSGSVIGDVDLGLGSNAFFNNTTGVFYSWDIVNLNGGLLQNAGLLSPGGPGLIKTTALNGSYEQTSTGAYAVDVDMGNGVSDRLDATGTASVAGTVNPDIIANPFTGTQQVTILTAGGAVTNNGTTVQDTALVDYSLLFGGNDVRLTMDVDFAPKGLAKEENGVGQHLNKVFTGGGPNSMENMAVALLRLPTVGAVSNAYEQLTGENYRALPIATLYSAEQFSDDMMSCPDRGDGGAYAFTAQNQCMWARARFRTLEMDANAATTGFNDDAIGISGGVQWALSGPWFAAVSLGYENSDIDTDRIRLSSDGDRFLGGASLKYINGPWLVAGAVTGGGSSYDSTRQISFPGFSSVAKSDQDLTDVGGQMRVAYQVGQGPWYAKPMVDLNVTYVDMDGFTESGGNGAALRVSSTDETIFSATPAFEVGKQFALARGTLVRPYVRGGVSFYSDADFPIAAAFAAAPGVTPFRTTGEIDNVLGNVAAGVTFLGVRGGVLSFGYDGSFGEDLEGHSAAARASMRF